MGDVLRLGTGPYSFVVWVNTSTTAEDTIVMAKHFSTVTAGYAIGINSGNTYGAANKAWFYNLSPPASPISTTTVNDGAWHQIVGVRGNDQVKIYVDGTPVESSQVDQGLGNTPAGTAFMVGGLISSGGAPVSYYTGLVDDIQVYNHALSDSEVQWLFDHPGHPACTPPPSGLVSWWGGDNNTLDLVGANHGALMNEAGYGPGKVAQALVFDGVNDYISVADHPSLNLTTAITIDAWIFSDNSSMAPSIVKKADDFSGYALELSADSSKVLFWVNLGSGGSGGWFSSPAGNLTQGVWTHVAGVFDGSSVGLYLNGQFIGATTAVGAIVPSSNPLNIGSDPETPTRFFKGLIDEVEIFNRALTAEEVAAVFNAGSTGKCRSCATPPNDIISWWSGDNNALDLVGTSPGTMMNGATYTTGKVGEAFNLDGVDDYIQVPSLTGANFPLTFTLDAWVKVSAYPSVTERVIAGMAGGYQLNLLPDGRIKFGFSGTMVISENPMPTGSFALVTGTVDGSGTVNIYINGALDKTGTTTPGTNANVFQIGGFGDFSGSFFQGVIDEVGLYGRVLSETEIQTLYNAGTTGMCPSKYLSVIPSGTGSGTVLGNGIDCDWNGSQTSGTCTVRMLHNRWVSLSTSADTGSTFAGWTNGSGSAAECSGTGNCEFYITQTSGVGAPFIWNTYTVTANAQGNGAGTVASNAGGVSYSYPVVNTGTTSALNHGTNVVLTATASAGSTAAWTSCNGTASGNGTGEAACTYSSLDGNKTATATFTLNQYTVTPSAGAHGSIQPNTPQTVNHGATAQFTVTADPGYTASVGGTCGGTLAGDTYTTNAITGPCTVEAAFTLNQYAVTPSAGPNGTIAPDTEQTFSHGATAQFTVTADRGTRLRQEAPAGVRCSKISIRPMRLPATAP